MSTENLSSFKVEITGVVDNLDERNAGWEVRMSLYLAFLQFCAWIETHRPKKPVLFFVPTGGFPVAVIMHMLSFTRQATKLTTVLMEDEEEALRLSDILATLPVGHFSGIRVVSGSLESILKTDKDAYSGIAMLDYGDCRWQKGKKGPSWATACVKLCGWSAPMLYLGMPLDGAPEDLLNGMSTRDNETRQKAMGLLGNTLANKIIDDFADHNRRVDVGVTAVVGTSVRAACSIYFIATRTSGSKAQQRPYSMFKKDMHLFVFVNEVDAAAFAKRFKLVQACFMEPETRQEWIESFADKKEIGHESSSSSEDDQGGDLQQPSDEHLREGVAPQAQQQWGLRGASSSSGSGSGEH